MPQEHCSDPEHGAITLQIYRHKSPDGEIQWVFDDPEADLDKEALVEGMPEIIAHALKQEGLPPGEPFTLAFLDTPFRNAPGRHAYSLTWLGESEGDGGNWYRLDGSRLQGWLCPALFAYFGSAPEKIHFSITS
jgi:hypothetical protein